MKIKHHDWHFHIPGGVNGPGFTDCIGLAKTLCSKVTNHGYVTHRRLSELMKNAHVQVLPSFIEDLD